jgi:hypothetical protein
MDELDDYSGERSLSLRLEHSPKVALIKLW